MDEVTINTLNTIVQGLASLFALSATFLVFKLQTLNQELRESSFKATNTLVYLEKGASVDYENVSLVDMSKRFKALVDKFDLKKEWLGIDYGVFQTLEMRWAIYEGELSKANEMPRAEYLGHLLKERANTLEHKVNYRLRLWLYSGTSGLVITLTILLALNMLAGLLPVNLGLYDLFVFVVVLANLSVLGVFWTIVYAVLGDPY